MSCAELFLKSGSSTFTGYFLIVGVTFILYGLYSANYILKTNSVETLEDELVALPSLCAILFGILLLILIIVGCCSVCREIPCCLECYSIFLALLASAQIGVGVFCLYTFQAQNAQLAERIYDDVTKVYLSYNDNPQEFDTIQQWLSCCGVTGPYNWVRDNHTIPLTCCGDTQADFCGILSPTRYTEGCSFMVYSYLTSTNYVIGWSLIIVAVTEVIAAMMGISLSCAFWRTNRVMWV